MNYFQIFCYCRVLKPNMAQPGPNFFRPVADCPCGKRRSSSSVSKSLAQRSLQKKADSCYRTQHLRSYIDLEDHVKIYLYFYTVSNRVNYVQKYIHFNTYICTNIDLPGFFFCEQPCQDWLISVVSTLVKETPSSRLLCSPPETFQTTHTIQGPNTTNLDES